MEPKSVLDFAKKNNAKILDLRFTDLLEASGSTSAIPSASLMESSFKDGFGFRRQLHPRLAIQIHESDMLLMPDPNTRGMDPFRETLQPWS